MGLFSANKSEVQHSNTKKSEVNLISVWFLGIIISKMLLFRGSETNHGPEMKEKM